VILKIALFETAEMSQEQQLGSTVRLTGLRTGLTLSVEGLRNRVDYGYDFMPEKLPAAIGAWVVKTSAQAPTHL
jgi:hypothetical protein